jgi:ketosteroid isomerase-like protein
MAATVLDDRESIRLLLRKINDAWVNGRTDELTEYFDADMVIVAPGFQGTERGRAACVNSYRDFVAQAKVHEYTESDATVDVWGDTGVATYRFHIVYDMGGATYRESGWDILVFGREAGTWRAVWRTLVVAP